MEPRFNHQGISDSMGLVIREYNAANARPMQFAEFSGAVAGAALGLFWQVGQSILSIACELRRFNDREEAKANNATPKTQESKQQ